MVKTLIAVIGLLGHRAVLALELVGAAAVIAGVAVAFGLAGGLIAGGVAALAKSLDVDLRGGDGG